MGGRGLSVKLIIRGRKKLVDGEVNGKENVVGES